MIRANLARRLEKLENTIALRSNRLVVRFEGPGSEEFRQPTQEEIDEAADVFTVRFVEARDGRPA